MTTLETIFLIYVILFAVTISAYIYFAHNAEPFNEEEEIAFKHFLKKRNHTKHA